METTLAETADHSIFVTEGRGDTLIVTPRGERTSFSEVDFSVELKRVQQLLDGARFDNIIIDLSQANYFGSEMIGVINGLLDQARRNGGRGGVCDVSDDMLEGLKIMNLDNYWPIYNTRGHAVGDIVNESVAQVTSRYAFRKFGAVVLAGGVLVAIAWFGSSIVGSFTPEPGESLFWRLEEIHDEAVETFRYNDRTARAGVSGQLNRRMKDVAKEVSAAALPPVRADAIDDYMVSLRIILQAKKPSEVAFADAEAARRRVESAFEGRALPQPSRPAPVVPADDEPGDGEDADADTDQPADGATESEEAGTGDGERAADA